MKLFLLPVLSTGLLGQLTTYNYAGTHFTSASSPFTTSESISGSFTTASALAPNLSNVDISSLIQSFSFSVGQLTWATANSGYTNQRVSTDSQGNITDWVFTYNGSSGSVQGIDMTTCYGAPLSVGGCPTAYDVVYLDSTPQTLSASNHAAQGAWLITIPAYLNYLYEFCGSDPNCPTGGTPGPVILGSDGSLYGEAQAGGVNNQGTIFKLTPNSNLTIGTLTTLYNFCSQPNCLDGNGPTGGLLLAKDGNFYGVTRAGGANKPPAGGSFSSGTIFKLTPGGTLTTLYNFCSQGPTCLDGAEPNAALIQGTDGNLYGTTGFIQRGFGGTIFKITPSGAFTTLFTFCAQRDEFGNCIDGTLPEGLIQATDGNFYGTTLGGGPYPGMGTVFKMTPSGSLTTLYTFCEGGPNVCADGSTPQAPLIQATDGNLYGTASDTVFKITTSGTLTTLYRFCSHPSTLYLGNCLDGGGSSAALLQASDGDFYGTTGYTIFHMTPSGELATLYNFCPYQCGGYEGVSPLVQTSGGTFFGTVVAGSTSYGGAVFSLSLTPPPAPPSILAGGVLNAASYAVVNGKGAPVAPGSLVVIFTSQLAAQSATFTGPSLPFSLGGVTLTVNVNSAPIVQVSPTGSNPYVTAQVPFEAYRVGFPAVPLELSVNGVATNSAIVSIVPSAPGIFTIPATGQGNAILVFENPATGSPAIAAPVGASLGYAAVPIPRGTSGFFYVTGLGAMTPPVADGSGTCPASNGLCDATATPQVLVGGISAQVAFAGQAPGFPGVSQINITVPQNAPTGNSVSLVVKSADGTVTSNSATIAVQ